MLKAFATREYLMTHTDYARLPTFRPPPTQRRALLFDVATLSLLALLAVGLGARALRRV